MRYWCAFAPTQRPDALFRPAIHEDNPELFFGREQTACPPDVLNDHFC